MCNNFPNIKVVEGNAFSVVVPLKVRTFESCRPIDENIDPTRLTNVVFKFGGVEYTPVIDERGVSAALPATLARGTYDIVVTGDYGDNPIRAAYEGAVTIVPWNSQSDAQQFLPGSPIVLEAAYIIGGALTDEELEALKEEYREKNAQLQQAIEDAEAAKAEWEQKAADLDGVAKESTSQQILQEVENIDIDTSDLAKEATLGTPAAGQPSTIFAAIAAVGGGSDDAKQPIVDAINAMGGSATTDMTWAQLAEEILHLPLLGIGQNELVGGHYWSEISLGVLLSSAPTSAARDIIKKIKTDDTFTITTQNAFTNFANLEELDTPNMNAGGAANWMFQNNASLRRVNVKNMGGFYYGTFQNVAKLEVLNVLNLVTGFIYALRQSTKIIDIIIGAGFVSSIDFTQMYYDPSNAYRNDISDQCYDSDLQEYGQLFSTNWDKWKWCIINHFAANLQDRTGMTAFTITFGSTVLSHFDAEMTAAFTNKNWTLA